MARSFSDKLLTGSRDRPIYRKPRPLTVCGWDVPSLFDDIGIVPWMKLQSQYHDKKASQKNKPPDDVIHFKHLPNKKCSALEDKSTFENESLHEHFYEKRQSPVPKNRRQRDITFHAQTAIPKPATADLPLQSNYRHFTSAKEYRRAKFSENLNPSIVTRKDYQRLSKNAKLLQKRKRINNKMRNIKDDMDAFSSEEDETEDGETLKRSRSVPIGEDVEFQIAKNAKLRRLLKIARLCGSRENIIFDEDEDVCDEGYGSKTPSAEDKEEDDRRTKPFNLMTWSITGQGLGTRENTTLYSKQTVGKFSYTHQQGNKYQLYGDSEDDKDDRVNDRDAAMEMSARIRYYQQKYGDSAREKGDYDKMLDRTYSTLGKSSENAPSYNLDIKPVTMVLRKITIQDSKESKSSEPKEIEGLPKTYLFRTNTSYPTERLPEKSPYSDRTQLPMGNASPEFKFTQNMGVTSQSSAKRINRPTSKAEIFKRTHLPYFDFERSNTNMPIGDLLPAVDRSILSKSLSKSQDINVSMSMPNTAREFGAMTRAVTEVVDKPKADEEVSYLNMDFMYPGKSQFLGGPPFRTNSMQKPQDQSSRKQQKVNSFNHPPPQPLIKSESKSRIAVNNPQSNANIGVRVTANPDKDTKKRLREAFSRFYNKQNVTARSVPDELQLMWNS